MGAQADCRVQCVRMHVCKNNQSVKMLEFKFKISRRPPVGNVFTVKKCVFDSINPADRRNSSISRMPGCGPNALPKNWI